jgi:hypothetical protein
MTDFDAERRTVLRGLAGASIVGAIPSAASASDVAAAAAETDPQTQATFAAVAGAIVPRTPGLGDELGAEHAPGAPRIELGDFFVTYVNDLFTYDPDGQGGENLRLAEPVADLLDEAASELLARNENEQPPDPTRYPEGGPFTKLAPMDRVRAMALLDDKELGTTGFPSPFPFAEGDGGLVVQLVVAFTEVLYYSEWDGYVDYTAPPSERAFTGEVQSWPQTDYPGPAKGYAALRGYVASHDGPLGGPPASKPVVGDAPPRDPDDDGRCEDVDGDGEVDVVDVQALFAHRESGVVQSNPRAFDFSDPPTGDGEVNVVDVQALFEQRGPRVVSLALSRQPGRFEDNEYDTSDYTEPFPESDGDSGGGGGGLLDAGTDGTNGAGDGLSGVS